MPSDNRPGGPANLAGIHYQLLRSLFHASRILDPHFDLKADQLRGYRLILEPPAGHDLEIESPDAVDVEQTKIRSQGTWGLSEIVSDILRNLYPAFAGRPPLRPIREARFVTNAPRGKWGKVERFFRELPPAGDPNKAPWLRLDDEESLGTASPRLQEQLQKERLQFTRRGLFSHIATVVTSNQNPGPEELGRVWELLRTFRFEKMDEEALKQDARHRLAGRVPTGIDLVLKALILDLLELGRSSATIETKELLAKYGLAELSLRDRQSLVSRSHQLLNRTLEPRYRAAEDVRAARWQAHAAAGARSGVENEPPKISTEVLCGEHGCGKTWALAALALALADQGRLVLFVEAAQSLDATCQRAAAAFCEQIWGADSPLSFERIHARLRTQDPANADRWLELLIDGVQTPDLAAQLAAYDWSGAGINLTFTFTTSGRELPAALQPIRQSEVTVFSTSELHDYLQRRLGDQSLQVYYSESSILRRPFLAGIYCGLAKKTSGAILPSSDFELLSLYWAESARRWPIAVSALADLAAQPPQGRTYPWSISTLRGAHMDEEGIRHLQGDLLSLSPDGGSAELWHDEILSWAVAVGLARLVADGELTADGLLARTRDLAGSNNPGSRWGQRWLRKSLLDVLWLLLAPGSGHHDVVRLCVESLHNELRSETLALLGPRIVPTLFELIAEHPRRSRREINALREIDSRDIASRAQHLLTSGASEAQVAAAEILIDHPAEEALDALWHLRRELDRQEPKDLNAIHGVVDKALAACIELADEWLRNAIRQADPNSDPIDTLVYLLRQMRRGRDLWRELKEVILAKVPEAGERCIAVCLQTFRDDEHLDWLEARVNRNGLIAGAARSALHVLRPTRPLDPIRGDSPMLAFTRGWWLLPHMNADPVLAQSVVAEAVQLSEDPWRIAWSLLGGFENRIRPDTLDLLLDETARRLATELAGPGVENRDPLRGPFNFLSKVMSLELIERFEARRGSSLERDLGTWLREHGPNNARYVRHREERARGVLERISGEEVSGVADAWLREGGTFWALQEAIDLAIMRPSESTSDRLFEVAMRESVEGSEHPIAQVQAIGALAALGRTDLAIRATMRWALKLSWKIINLLVERQPSDADLELALDAVTNTNPLPDPNAVFALGLGRRAADVPAILGILRCTPSNSDLALACLLALRVNGDSGTATTQAFIDHLRWPRTEYVCALGLLHIRTQEALAALKSRLDGLGGPSLSSSDNAVFIAVNLLDMEETRIEVATRLWETLDRDRILFVAQGNLSSFAELARAEVDEWLWNIAFGDSSYYRDFDTQVGAIRALSRRFPARSFEAALRLLELDSSDREETPELLLEVDSGQALPRLRARVRDEESVVLLTIIGENLQAAKLEASLIEWLGDSDSHLREGACIAAQVFAWSEALDRALQGLLYDLDWDVRNAANTALDRLWHAREVDRLVDTLLAESDRTRRWCLLDVALGAGYPGLQRQQPWVTKLFQGSLPLIMRQRITARLEERTKEVRSETAKRERPSAS
jgi:hypothetical protein